MLTLLTAGLLSMQAVTLMPTDDIWVYPHASDPAGDPFIRVWGIDGDSVPSSSEDAGSFSMGYLKFSFASIPKGSEIKSAKLVVHQVAPAGYGVGDAKAAPLEARWISSKFAEKGWSADILNTILPKREGLLGSGSPEKIDGATIPITIELSKEPEKLNQALAEGEIAIALTSAINAAELGRSAIYKVYSREEKDANLVPKLIVELK